MLDIQPEDFLAVQQLAKVHVKLNDIASAMDVLLRVLRLPTMPILCV